MGKRRDDDTGDGYPASWLLVVILLGLLVGEILWIAVMVWIADIIR